MGDGPAGTRGGPGDGSGTASAPRRVVLDLVPGSGPIAGRFKVAGCDEATSFASWMELLALLERVRRDDRPAP